MPRRSVVPLRFTLFTFARCVEGNQKQFAIYFVVAVSANRCKDSSKVIYQVVQKETIASSLRDFFNKQLLCKKRLHNVLIGSKI